MLPTPVARRRSTLSGHAARSRSEGAVECAAPARTGFRCPHSSSQGQGHCRRGRGVPADAKLDGPPPIRRRRLSRQERRGSASVLRQQLCVPLEALVAVARCSASSRRSSSSRQSPDKGGQGRPSNARQGESMSSFPLLQMPPEASACPGTAVYGWSLPAGPAPGAPPPVSFPPAGTAGLAGRAGAYGDQVPDFAADLQDRPPQGETAPLDIVLSR